MVNFANSGQLVRSRAVLLNETAETVAGVHTARVRVPAGVLVDVMVIPIAVWNASGAVTGKVGDGDDDDGFWTGLNLKTLAARKTLDFAGGVAGEAGVGVYIDGSAHAVLRSYSATARTIAMIVTAAGTAGTTGRTLFVVQSVAEGYAYEPTFVAS